ncbi:MAG: cellulose binding domain-containing protein [Actinomycetota bacterium]
MDLTTFNTRGIRRSGTHAPRLRAAVVGGLVAVASLAAVSPARAATIANCARFGTVPIAGNQYIYQQDEWNSTATQCASVDDVSGSWSITQTNLNAPVPGNPAAYPSTFRGCHWGTCTANSGLPLQVSAIGNATSSWSTNQVSAGAYDVAYDVWTNSTPTTSGQPNGSEIMIWLGSRGGVRPYGNFIGTGTLSGATWNVYAIRTSRGWNIVSYERTTPTTSVTDLDIRGFLLDSVQRGWTNASWYLLDVEAGFEIWQGGQGLGTSSFSFSASTQPAPTPTPTTTPTPTETPTPTPTETPTPTPTPTETPTPTPTPTETPTPTPTPTSTPTPTPTPTPTSTPTPTATPTPSETPAPIPTPSETPTPEPTPTATTTPDPTPTPAPTELPPPASLRVRYQNDGRKAVDKRIAPGFRLVNTGSSTVTLAGVTLRYWFTRDGGARTYSVWCATAQIDCVNVTQRVVNITPARRGADAYLEVGFTSGTLAAGESSDVHVRIRKTDGSNFKERDDYSYGSNGAFADSQRVVAYENGVVRWGTEPA